MSALKYLFGEQAVSFRYAQENYTDINRQELMEAILPANGTWGRDITRFVAKAGILSYMPYQQPNPNDLQIGDVNELGAIYLGHSVTVGTPLWIQPPHPRGDQRCDYDGACAYIQSMPYEMGYKGSRQLKIVDLLKVPQDDDSKPVEYIDGTEERNLLDLKDPQNDDGGWRLPDIDEAKQILDVIKNNKALAKLLQFRDSHYLTCRVGKVHKAMDLWYQVQDFNNAYQHHVPVSDVNFMRLVRTEKRVHLQAA